MLSREDNELLCRVGPGTPMGNLLRQYWMPALPSSEFPGPDSPTKRMRLLGENLVMFRDSKGRVGAVPEACPQRGVRPALRVPRLEVRRGRQLRRHADRTPWQHVYDQGQG